MLNCSKLTEVDIHHVASEIPSSQNDRVTFQPVAFPWRTPFGSFNAESEVQLTKEIDDILQEIEISRRETLDPLSDSTESARVETVTLRVQSNKIATGDALEVPLRDFSEQSDYENVIFPTHTRDSRSHLSSARKGLYSTSELIQSRGAKTALPQQGLYFLTSEASSSIQRRFTFVPASYFRRSSCGHFKASRTELDFNPSNRADKGLGISDSKVEKQLTEGNSDLLQKSESAWCEVTDSPA